MIKGIIDRSFSPGAVICFSGMRTVFLLMKQDTIFGNINQKNNIESCFRMYSCRNVQYFVYVQTPPKSMAFSLTCTLC